MKTSHMLLSLLIKATCTNIFRTKIEQIIPCKYFGPTRPVAGKLTFILLYQRFLLHVAAENDLAMKHW